jgi:hypothetical protein
MSACNVAEALGPVIVGTIKLSTSIDHYSCKDAVRKSFSHIFSKPRRNLSLITKSPKRIQIKNRLRRQQTYWFFDL